MQTNAAGPFSVSVDWGDGTPDSSFDVASADTIPAMAHTFAGSASDTVTVTVIDSANNSSNNSTFAVTVGNHGHHDHRHAPRGADGKPRGD